MAKVKKYLTETLQKHEWGTKIAGILSSAIDAVEPGETIHRFLKRNGDRLLCHGEILNLNSFEHVYLLAFGKAALPMSSALVDILGETLTQGWVVPKHIAREFDPRLTVRFGSHPLPDENSIQAGEMLLDAAKTFTEKDLVFCLISGG